MKRIVSAAAFLIAFAIVAAGQDIPNVINGGVLNGKAVKLPKPAYPEEAKKAGLGGAVNVRVVIDENGNVIEAAAIREVPENEPAETTALYNLLGEAAEKAALDATFSPTRLSGQPVKVSGVITYNFLAKSKMDNGPLNGKALELPKPAYPPAAAAVRAGGSVSVMVTIDENGDVESAVAVSGHPLLRPAAVEAARNARFNPTLADGKAVKVSGVLTYNFVPPDSKPNQ